MTIRAICGRVDGTGVSDSFFKAFFKSPKEGLKDGSVVSRKEDPTVGNLTNCES